jgi:hypothetical protein
MVFTSQFKAFNKRFTTDINLPFYFFLAAVFIVLGSFFFCVIRNLNIFGLFEYAQPDFTFTFYTLSIIFACVAIYKLIRYYFEFHALEYLIVAFFLFGTIVSLFLWQIYIQYLTSLWQLVNSGDHEGYWRIVEPEVNIGRLAFFGGELFLLIYAVRLRDWKDYNVYLKFIITVVFINTILMILQDFLVHLFMWFNYLNIINLVDVWDYYAFFPYLTIQGIMQTIIVDILALNLPYGFEGLFMSIFLVYYFLVFNLFTTPNTGKSKLMTVAKIFWLLYAFIQFSLTAVQIFLVGVTGTNWHEFFTVMQVFFLAGFIIMLYYAPELVLVTDRVLFRAKKLYRVMEDVEPSSTRDSAFSLPDFTNFGPRIKAYVDSIPPDVLEELKQKSKIRI